ncbi:hypothetical protein ACROAK_22595 [Shewanella oncorhynchi]|uniref:hypothetical protein n=1 Tax=Shewanella oncorhynchi TaxID=2726434 RepID=UPI003D7A4FB8
MFFDLKVSEVRMVAKWEKGNCPTDLIKEIKGKMKINASNQLSYSLDLPIFVDALFSCVEHEILLDRQLVYEKFELAIKRLFEEDRLKDTGKILPLFCELCEEIHKEKKKYFLVTTINVKEYVFKSRMLNGCKISFYKNIPQKYSSTRRKLMKIYSEKGIREQENYQFVVVSVEAGDERTAYRMAMQALDIFRSILHIGFVKNANFFSLNMSETYSSNSIVSIGQFHTIHNENGKNCSDIIWVEDFYQEKVKFKIRNSSITENEISIMIRKINKSKFREHITNALVNYINSIDVNDLESRFLKLWATFEQLLKSDNSDILVKRISFFFNDREVSKRVFLSLRKARNISSHTGKEPYNKEMKNFILALNFEVVIRHFINNHYRYKSLNDFLEFISMTTDPNALNKQNKNIRNVKRFIGKG